jgi:hypothetical protein
MSKISGKYRLPALLALVVIGATAAAPSFAQVYYNGPIVRVAPPPPRYELRPPPPGRGFFWRPGYWAWTGNAYFWHRGDWYRRPHPNAIWIEPRWERRGGGWIYREGRWR